MTKKNILIDLDGVLNEYKGVYEDNNIPELREGARDFLSNLAKNYFIKIFTTRNINLTRKWILKNNIEQYISGITNIKEPSYLIIDDRCITFDGSYQNTLRNIQKFNVWYKNN